MTEKLKRLEEILQGFQKAAIAYSGGVDSDFLLNYAAKTLGKENVIAVIADGAMLAPKDLLDAAALADEAGIRCFILHLDVFSVPEFLHNNKKRCYYCKKNIMGNVLKKAEQEGFSVVLDGKNADDGRVYRPGASAAVELGIRSPLFEAGFTKADIRQAAKNMGLSTWEKASNSCLATRFPYDTILTEKDFSMVAQAEEWIANAGISSARLRVHGAIARIEMPKEYFTAFLNQPEITENIKSLGFQYVTLDLEGFRSGSMD